MDVLVFYGSVRTERQGIKAARYVMNKLQERGHNAFLVDPMEYKFPLLERKYKEYEKGTAPAGMDELSQKIRSSDAYVIVSGEYNHSIPPALSNLLDYFYEEYFFKPSGIVCYSSGALSGVRAAMQLRAFLAEIGTVSIHTLFAVPAVQDSFTTDGQPNNPKSDEFIKPFLDELEWYAAALKKARTENGTPY